MVRNAMQYGGDPTGQRFARSRIREFVTSLPPNVLSPAQTWFLKPASMRPRWRTFAGPWLHDSLQSFWARFGWMNVVPPRAWVSTALLVLGCVVVASWFARGGGGASAWWGVPRLFALPALALLLAASIANSYFVDYQPQGRYLLACVPGLVLQIVGATSQNAASTRSLSRGLLVLLFGFFVAQNLFMRLAVLR
jgi:hypothetical protein